MSLSSTEAEYKALTDASKEVQWLSNLMTETHLTKEHNTSIIRVDNRGAIDLAHSQTSQNSFRTKHMDLWLHFIQNKTIGLRFVSSSANKANFLTKPVGRSKIIGALKKLTEHAMSINASCPEARSTADCQILGPGPTRLGTTSPQLNPALTSSNFSVAPTSGITQASEHHERMDEDSARASCDKATAIQSLFTWTGLM